MTYDQESRTELRSRLVTIMSMLMIIAVFAVSAMLVVAVGMRVYEHIVIASDSNFELRTSLSYVATRIRQTDGSARVNVREEDGITVLELTEDIEGIEAVTYIYHRDGGLYEYMAVSDEKFDQGAGFLTMEVDSFSVSKNGTMIKLRAGNAAGEHEELTVYVRESEGRTVR